VSDPGVRRRDRLVPDLERFHSVKVIGLGGVGGIAARYLVAFLAALGCTARVLLIDGDEFEVRNAERMLFSRCGNKAAVVRDDLLGVAEGSALTLAAIEEYVTPDNLDRLLRDDDVILLAVDNHATRKLVAKHCQGLRNVCLISGGNDGVGEDGAGELQRGTYGNVQIQIRSENIDRSPPLTAYHPEIATPRDVLPSELSCTEAMQSVPQILFANLATASAMLNTFLLHVCGTLEYPELCFDIAEGRMQPLPLKPKPMPLKPKGPE
jgi:predicted ThiF/HesA family dinucleotide-utilizing enzyme